MVLQLELAQRLKRLIKLLEKCAGWGFWFYKCMFFLFSFYWGLACNFVNMVFFFFFGVVGGVVCNVIESAVVVFL